MNEVGIALVWCAAQVTLIGVLAAVVYAVARRIGPAAGSLVVITSLLVIVALSALAFSPWPHWPVVVSTASSEHVSAQPGREATPAAADSASDPASAERAGPEQISGAPDLPGTNQAAPNATLWQALLDELSAGSPPSEVPQRRWTTIVAILFFVAAGAGFLWVVAGLVAVRSYRLRSRQVHEADLLELVDLLRAELGCRRPIELREADGLVTATTFGWRRPVILLPTEWTDWTQAERRAVLAHEIAHIRHNDFLACLGGQLGLALHFYHPLVHWLVGRLRLEQELAADATAAALAGGKGLYLRTLAEIALRQEDRFVAWPARTFLPTRNTFLRRIQMLRHSKQRSTSLSLAARVLTVSAFVLLGLIVAGLRGPVKQQTAMAQETPRSRTGKVSQDAVLDRSHVAQGALPAGGKEYTGPQLAACAAARTLAVMTGEIEYRRVSGNRGMPKSNWTTHRKMTKSGTSFRLRYPGRPTTRINHDGQYMTYHETPQPDGRLSRALAVQRPRPIAFEEHDEGNVWGHGVFGLGGIFFPETREYLKKHAGRTRLVGTEVIDGVETRVVELRVPKKDVGAAFRALYTSMRKGDGGVLRLNVAPQMGFVVPKLESVDLQGNVLERFTASGFRERAPGLWFPQEASREEVGKEHGYFVEYEILWAKSLNAPVNPKEFVITIPAGTRVSDSRSYLIDFKVGQDTTLADRKDYKQLLDKAGFRLPEIGKQKGATSKDKSAKRRRLQSLVL